MKVCKECKQLLSDDKFYIYHKICKKCFGIKMKFNHEKRRQELISKLKDEPPLCKCGCGRYTKRSKSSPFEYNIYIHGHYSMNKREIKKAIITRIKNGNCKSKEQWQEIYINAPLCKCGCKEQVKWNKSLGKYNIYIHGHASRGRKMSLEQRRQLSEFKKGKKHTLNHRIKISCTLQNISLEDWNGFCNDKGYCDAWNDKLYKHELRRRDYYKCQICGKTTNENKQNLALHHINYDKEDCRPNNLITLCHSCHSKTNINRKYWKKYFKKYMKNKKPE